MGEWYDRRNYSSQQNLLVENFISALTFFAQTPVVVNNVRVNRSRRGANEMRTLCTCRIVRFLIPSSLRSPGRSYVKLNVMPPNAVHLESRSSWPASSHYSTRSVPSKIRRAIVSFSRGYHLVKRKARRLLARWAKSRPQRILLPPSDTTLLRTAHLE